MSRVRVVAAVIEREGRFLLGLRPEHKRHGGLWEFPGGKVDPGEDADQAARRELDEEMRLEVMTVGSCLLAVEESRSSFVIEFFEVTVRGEPQALEHSELAWHSAEELRGMPLAPADADFVRWLLDERAADGSHTSGGQDGPARSERGSAKG